jgi:hypothetical protein
LHKDKCLIRHLGEALPHALAVEQVVLLKKDTPSNPASVRADAGFLILLLYQVEIRNADKNEPAWIDDPRPAHLDGIQD